MNEVLDGLLTRNEAEQYLEKQLNIKNFEEKVKKDRVSALNELIIATFNKYPFQDVDLMATPSHLRRVPTVSDMRRSHFSGKGALCITLNTFIKHVIYHFGYRAYMAGATVIGNDPESHSVVIVQDLVYPGDLHLVDVGCGYPTFEAIPITETPRVYKHSFLEWTLVKIGDDTYGRYHLKGDDRYLLTAHGSLPTEDKKFYSFSLQPTPYSYFCKSMNATFTDDAESIFLRYVFVAYYPQGKAFTLKKDQFKIFDEETGKLTSRVLNTYEDFMDVFKNYLHVTFDDDELKKAVEIYLRVKSEEENGHCLGA